MSNHSQRPRNASMISQTSFRGSLDVDMNVEPRNSNSSHHNSVNEFADVHNEFADAVAVDMAMEDVFLDDERPDSDSRKYRPSKRVNRFIMFASLFVLSIVLASVFRSSRNHNHNKDQSNVPTPTTPQDDTSNNNNVVNTPAFGMTTYQRDPTQANGIAKSLTNQLGSTYFENSIEISGFPYQVRQTALSWLLYEDPLQLTAADDNLLQRFILVLFYFHTTRYHPWEECNPPEDAAATQQELCFHPLYRDDDSLQVWGHRWLGAFHECLWAGVLCDRDTKVVLEVQLPFNKLNGPIPWELTALTDLVDLHLGSNALTGSIPPELAELNKLHDLSLSKNHLTGTIPPGIFSHSEGDVPMMYLSLSRNKLTGTIPTQVGLMNGTYLYLGNNDLSGTIPVEVFRVDRLINWDVGGNKRLTGTIPTEIGLSRHARWIQLAYTGVSGSMPSQVGVLSNLEEFNLTGTNLGGAIPEEFYTGMRSLKYVDLGECQFTGTISTNIGKLEELRTVRMDQNKFQGTIPTEITSPPNLWRMEFQGNNLWGSVHPEVCALQDHNTGWGNFTLVADCTPDQGVAAVECPKACCTTCCSAQTGVCTKMET